jgi:hypothetical protein
MRIKLSVLFIAIAMIGFFAFTGGAISMLTYRVLRERDSKVEQPNNALYEQMDLQ